MSSVIASANPAVGRVQYGADVQAAGQRGAVRIRLGDDDGGGADGVGVQRGQHADRPGTGDEHDVTTVHADPVDPVGGDAGRFDDRALDVGHGVRQRGDLVVLEHRVLGQAAGLGAQPGAGEPYTQVAETATAEVAPAADDRGHDRHPVADPDVGDVCADLHHPRRELVPERLRQA